MTSSSPNLSASSVSKNLVMEAERPVSRIDRKSSIESEPRTLSLRQMERAREAALIVLNTRSIEDAMSIFTEGLQPVLRVGNRMGPESYYYDHIDDKLLGSEPRDVATAPF
ncbi:uncharacterized protein LOC116198889 isoform X1 [Punica granatum]|uniref:Uncharacterized protein LOC116198889 isoform X1 n=1 Tax=Punica granatum TaxID=22663 RepID=A0A6P8CUA4_PUNGR|nr:uncharacterized protein LOC116198889 isoform X1 [Punica granatum]